ncbi:hypothetical protein P154DRAFT_582220 [Amniculicola lignicola CBS 123094]|uniref:Uncharacterized protein n=1 Tax=Amniculicola lignicola CBS 123094 TaxID=1392246 RepID=A0A6A5VW83_9PLEO|nr:hypothetical protein P154DRAFT_582220 [Amniculicola lignicola CBS 123094]
MQNDGDASRPWSQFEVQVAEEIERMRQNGTLGEAADTSLYDVTAGHVVEEDWKLQGIYEKEWNHDVSPDSWLWKQQLDRQTKLDEWREYYLYELRKRGPLEKELEQANQ